MADSHPTDEGHDSTNDTEGQSEPGPKSNSRRTFLKTIGAAAALTGAGSMVGEVSAAQDANYYLNQSGEVHVPAGEYSWDGSDLSLGSSDKLIGDGNPGDVVFNLESGTMYGTISGHLENITVRGANQDAGSGLRVQPGATIDGFVWPEGGQKNRDMGIYSSDGGNDRLTIRNSGWAWMVNNGAYVDKPPVTIENCVAANNNIAGIRVGHRDGTSSSQTTYIRNSIIAVTRDVPHDRSQSGTNARGLRVRHPANVVVENCWFVYLDVDQGGDLVVFHDGAAGSNVTFRNCAFYNDSSGELVRDKTGGDVDLTIENCTVEGSGSREVELSYSGSGFTEASAEYPLPSQVTGHSATDEIEGIGPGIGPWTEDGAATSGSTDHSLVLHTSPDNSTDVDISFTVDGSISYGPESESGTDTIVSNDDGTVTATSIDLNPDSLDSYWFDGSIVDYSVPTDAVVDVAVDGTTTSFADLVETDSSDGSTDDDSSEPDTSDWTVVEVIAHQDGGLDYEFSTDGEVEKHETGSTVAAGGNDEVVDNGDGTWTVTGFTGNVGYGDAYLVDGSLKGFTSTPSEDDYDFDLVVDGETVDPATIGDAGSDENDSTDDSSTDSSTDDSSTDSSTDDSSTDDTKTREVVFHAHADNKKDIDVSITVDGWVDYSDESESHTDTVDVHDDNTVTITSVDLDPDALDSYLIHGPVIDYSVEDGGMVDVAVDGTSTTLPQLVIDDNPDSPPVGEQTRKVLFHADPGNRDGVDVSITVDGWVDYSDESESHTDTVDVHDDNTVTITSVDLDPDALDSYLIHGPVIDYSLPSSGSVDLAIDGSKTSFADLVESDSTDSSSTDSSSSGELPHRISIVGSSTKQASEYTFTVSGDVVRDAEASYVSEDSSPWDQMEDIARDGKVIGIVGSGVDAYRFEGIVEDVTVNGTAKVEVVRDV